MTASRTLLPPSRGRSWCPSTTAWPQRTPSRPRPRDCYAAFLWTVENAADLGIDPERIGVGGDSAGANLAAGVSLMARDRGGPTPCFQFLRVPAVDDRLDTSSMAELTDTPILKGSDLPIVWDLPRFRRYSRAEDQPADQRRGDHRHPACSADRTAAAIGEAVGCTGYSTYTV